MPRLSVESRALSDPRFRLLARNLGLVDADHARGKILHVWLELLERGVYVLPVGIIDAAADCEGFAEALVAAELAESAEGGVRVRGAAGRIEWLSAKRQASSDGGKARAAGMTQARRSEVAKAAAAARWGASVMLADACPTAIAPTTTTTTTTETKEETGAAAPRPKKTALKRYSFGEAFGPEPAKARLAADFVQLSVLPEWPTILEELTRDHGAEFPGGQAFTSVDRWARRLLAVELRALRGRYGRWKGRAGVVGAVLPVDSPNVSKWIRIQRESENNAKGV